jgi:hypothetical protein
MQYRKFGRTGLSISPIGLGTVNFSWLTNEAYSFAILDKALAQREFLAGDRFSIADILALCTIEFAGVAANLWPDPQLRHGELARGCGTAPSARMRECGLQPAGPSGGTRVRSDLARYRLMVTIVLVRPPWRTRRVLLSEAVRLTLPPQSFREAAEASRG